MSVNVTFNDNRENTTNAIVVRDVQANVILSMSDTNPGPYTLENLEKNSVFQFIQLNKSGIGAVHAEISSNTTEAATLVWNEANGLTYITIASISTDGGTVTINFVDI